MGTGQALRSNALSLLPSFIPSAGPCVALDRKGRGDMTNGLRPRRPRGFFLGRPARSYLHVENAISCAVQLALNVHHVWPGRAGTSRDPLTLLAPSTRWARAPLPAKAISYLLPTTYNIFPRRAGAAFWGPHPAACLLAPQFSAYKIAAEENDDDSSDSFNVL